MEQQSRDTGEYLVTLREPSAGFARQIETGGGRVLDQSKSGLRWLVSISWDQSEALRRLRDVKEVEAAVSVMIEFDTSAGDLNGALEALGGLATERYTNVSVLTAAIPFGKTAAVRALSGVRRVTKQRTFIPTQQPERKGLP
jgi:hypothetical protein